MMLVPGFAIPEVIVNRALQHVGAERIVSLADNSKAAAECAFVYHRLRQAELRRNNWEFAIKRRMLYPITTTTMAWSPPTYAAATTYPVGAVVAYDDTYGARLYLSNKAGNVGNTPGTDNGWEDYFGQVTPDLWASGSSYWAGDLRIDPLNPTNVYISLINSNQAALTVGTSWVAVNGTLTPIELVYPIGAGPTIQSGTD